MTSEDLDALRQAADWLENPGFAARLANLIGEPFEKLVKMLPACVNDTISRTVSDAIGKCLQIAVRGIDRGPAFTLSERVLKAAVGVTGAASGAFGLPALAIELPITTTIMLRSIAAIARAEGEDLVEPEAQLACLEVFALGARSSRDDRAQAGYFAVRAALARAVQEAAKYIAERGIAEEGAPVLVRLIAAIASRFGIVVSEKAAAGAVPAIGAIGGAGVNVLFIDHFQTVAHGHFLVRGLERKYGAEAVRREYELIAAG